MQLGSGASHRDVVQTDVTEPLQILLKSNGVSGNGQVRTRHVRKWAGLRSFLLYG